MANEDQYIEKLDKLLEDSPEMKQVYDMISSVLTENDNDEVEIESVEIDGTYYMIIKEFVIKGTTYVHLVNETDPLDMMYRKIIIEDGEEYLVGLDSEQEFDLVVAYEQKYIWRDIKRKQDMTSDNNEE